MNLPPRYAIFGPDMSALRRGFRQPEWVAEQSRAEQSRIYEYEEWINGQLQDTSYKLQVNESV
jgi:hypothetical protein